MITIERERGGRPEDRRDDRRPERHYQRVLESVEQLLIAEHPLVPAE
jgi:hypothetical protein